MRKRALLRWTVLWLATMLPVTAALGQEKYRLQDAAASGDYSTNESSLEFSLKVQATANGQSAGEFSLVRRDHEKYNEQILADEAGSPSRIRRIYMLSRSIESDPTGAEKLRVTSLQGKTVTIQRHGGKVTVTATSGELAAEDRDTLMDALDDSAAQFFPDREVTPGEEWPIDPNTAARWFHGMVLKKTDLRCRFQDVVQFAGHRCARIHLTFRIEAEPEGVPGRVNLTISGDGYHALDLQRPLAVELTGPVTMKGQTTANGATLMLSGEGTMRMKATQQWLKVAGKPIEVKGDKR